MIFLPVLPPGIYFVYLEMMVINFSYNISKIVQWILE